MSIPRPDLARRLVGLATALLGVLAALALVPIAPAAAADGPAPMTLTNPSTGGRTGNQFVRPQLALSAPCPQDSTTFYARLYGGDAGSRFPALGGLIKVPGYLGMSFTEPFTVDAEYTFVEAAQDAGFTTLAGRYRAEVVCQDDFSHVLRRFATTLRFTSPKMFVAAPAASGGTADPSAAPTPSASEPAAGPATPEATPASEPGIVATDVTGVPLEPSPVLRPGQTVRVRAGGFPPGQRVEARFGGAGGPAVEALADGNGIANFGVTIPDGAGRQSFTVTDGETTSTLKYRVAGEPIGGSSDGPNLLLVAALVGGGVLLLMLVAAAVLRRGDDDPEVDAEPTPTRHVVGRS